MIPQFCALAKDKELDEPNLIDFICQVPQHAGQCVWFALHQFRRPLQIRDAPILVFQRPEEAIVFPPVFLQYAKLLELTYQIFAFACAEVSP
jgi:hypothetical protein